MIHRTTCAAEKNRAESGFPLDRSIMVLLYERKACENMNKVRS